MNSFNVNSPERRKNTSLLRFVLLQGNASGRFIIGPDNTIKRVEQKTN